MIVVPGERGGGLSLYDDDRESYSYDHGESFLQTFRIGPSTDRLCINVQPGAALPVPTAPVNERIREIALVMGIKIVDNAMMQDWPMIKCNISSDGHRIYHLPMDQKYDWVKISKPGEQYVQTAAEAERAGFRGAKRWVPAS